MVDHAQKYIDMAHLALIQLVKNILKLVYFLFTILDIF